MKKRIGVYAGMFDPLTVGHLWVIEEGVKLFDELIVAVGNNPEKNPLFSKEERVAMLEEATQEKKSVTVKSFDTVFLVDFARDHGAQSILRSIRTESDYEYERALHHINKDMDPDLSIVFVMPPRKISEISSSMVKQLLGFKHWEKVVRNYVPENVLAALKNKV